MKEVNFEEFEIALEKVKQRSFKVKPKKDLNYVLAKMKLYKVWLEGVKKEILAI